MTEGKLFVCATPIGNLNDVSERLRATLGSADVVYAEDTRRTATLLQHVGASPRVRSYFAGNEARRTEELIGEVRSGKVVALVTDAGMPSVSDPGARAVAAAHDQGLEVTVVPGPSAVSAAVAVSGFGGDRFVFEGFLPRKGGERAARIAEIAAEQRPVVLFASPNRFGGDLADLAEIAGPERRVAVVRELSKLHEEVWVGSLGEATERWRGEVKGEVTLVVEGAAPGQASLEEALRQARSLMEGGETLSEAARTVSGSLGLSRRRLYEALLEDQGRS